MQLSTTNIKKICNNEERTKNCISNGLEFSLEFWFMLAKLSWKILADSSLKSVVMNALF